MGGCPWIVQDGLGNFGVRGYSDKQQVMVISEWLAQTRDLGLQTITKLRFCTVCVCAHT